MKPSRAVQVGPKPKDKCPHGDTRRETNTGRREGRGAREAESAVMQPRAKGRLEPPEARRGKDRAFPRGFGESLALPTP